MDKHLAVNVYDADGNAIPGAQVLYKVKFKGGERLIGPIEIQGVKDRPASIQIPSPIDDPVIEVTASFKDQRKSILVDTRQTKAVVIQLEVTMDKPNPEPNPSPPTPWQVLNEARKAVPAVNYALGVAGIAAAVAIINLFIGPTKASLVIVGLVFIGMILLFAFAQLTAAKSYSIQIAGIFLLWAVLSFFVIFLGFTVTAFATEWPVPWARFLGIAIDSNSSARSPRADDGKGTKIVQSQPTKLGPENRLLRVTENSGKISVPPNSVLTAFQLGKDAPSGPRWLEVFYRTVLGDSALELGQEEYSFGSITPPSHDGGSGNLHLPEGTVISAIQLGGGPSFTVWYRKHINPANFTLGPEVAGKFPNENTKEPAHDGGGNIARKEGHTMTGFQWLRDPDGQTALLLWWRPIF